MWLIAERFAINENFAPRKGGMAEVFKAVDTLLGGHVAVKLFDPRLCQDERLALEAFSRETKSLHELNEHPHVARMLDCGTDDTSSRKFIVLEWLENDLEAWLRSKPPKGWDDFYSQYGQPVINALRFAHGRGILHRDIKPQNILLTDEAVVKVADFGIAKFKAYHRPGITLAHFASAPYAPPERDSGQFADTRDVYSFAVLCMEALQGESFSPDTKIDESVHDFDAPQEIISLFERAVNSNPANRPANIQEFFEQLESIHESRKSHSEKKFPCYIRLSPRVRDQFFLELNESTQGAADEYLLSDLNDTLAIDRWRFFTDGREQESPDQFAFFSAEHRYQVAVDSNHRDRLIVVKAVRGTPSNLEALRERAWNALIEFHSGIPPVSSTAAETIRMLNDGLDTHLAERRLKEARNRENRLFDTWAGLLRLQEAQQSNLETPIKYRGFEVDGHRITFSTTSVPDPAIIDQGRLIRLDDKRAISGVVDAVTERSVTLYCDLFIVSDIPTNGEITFDTRLARMAIQRQFAAIDSVRFDRAVRSDMRRVIIDPSSCREPTNVSIERFFQEDLDEYKQAAVCGALSAPDFFVVEGPPGTGKTKFIAELILQQLARDPASRILLSSQTHNALDNAIERIQPLATDRGKKLRIVRVASRTDTRVAKKVQNLLLENQVYKWLKEVRSNSEFFVERWAVGAGLDKVEIEMGLAVARLRRAKLSMESARSNRAAVVQQIERIENEEKKAREIVKVKDTHRQLQLELEELRRDLIGTDEVLSHAVQSVKEAHEQLTALGDDGKELADQSPAELEEWETLLVQDSPAAVRCKTIIELLEEWFERFGRSSDFHGAFVADAEILAGTCIGIAKKGLQDIDYDMCIVDEASKATPPETLVPTARARKWVIVGDPRQLPPFVAEGARRSVTPENFGLSRDDLRDTLLNHLIRNIPSPCHARLENQYRMVRPIGNMVSACFYDGALKSEYNPNFELDKFDALPKPVTWFSTSRLSMSTEQRVGRSYKNLSEVEITRRFLRRLDLAGKALGKSWALAILTGYLPQVREFERMATLLLQETTTLSIECQTVDAYQGREADIVVYSVVRSNDSCRLGFLKERERLNVALSRGRLGLAIVGDSAFCQGVQGENPFSDVLSYIRNHAADCCLRIVDE